MNIFKKKPLPDFEYTPPPPSNRYFQRIKDLLKEAETADNEDIRVITLTCFQEIIQEINIYSNRITNKTKSL